MIVLWMARGRVDNGWDICFRLPHVLHFTGEEHEGFDWGEEIFYSTYSLPAVVDHLTLFMRNWEAVGL